LISIKSSAARQGTLPPMTGDHGQLGHQALRADCEQARRELDILRDAHRELRIHQATRRSSWEAAETLERLVAAARERHDALQEELAGRRPGRDGPPTGG
jgi:hypothetical protein